MINRGRSHTSKGKENFNHLSNFIPRNIPTAILTKNCAPIPAYRINSRFDSFLVFNFKKLFVSYTFNVFFNLVKNNKGRTDIL